MGIAAPPKRAVGYVRVSQVGGREGESFLSPDVQREKIEAWAAYRGYRIVEWYIDLDRPASKGAPPRPEFERMMDDARAGRFDAVAVYRLTRFSRSIMEASSRYDELERLGVDLVSVTEDIDTTTAGGRFMRNVLAAMAEFESERVGEEWRAVHANRRKRGIAHAPSGVYGYRVEGAEPVEVEQAEAPAIRLMFDLRGKGDGLGAIQTALEERGFRSPRGHTRFAKTTLLAILANPLYAGLVRLADGELIDGRHPAIVTREVWDRVQAVSRRANALARHSSGALLAGLLVCHACGYRLRHEGPRPSVNTRGGRYRCPHKDMGETCPHPVQIGRAAIEEYVEEAFVRRFDPKRMPHGGRIKRTTQQATWEKKAARLRARADELSRALDALADQRYVKGTLAAEEYDRQFTRYAGERAEVLEEADELERMAKTVQPLDRDALSLWPTLPADVKRRALLPMIDRIVVKPYDGPPGRARLEPIENRVEIAWLR